VRRLGRGIAANTQPAAATRKAAGQQGGQLAIGGAAAGPGQPRRAAVELEAAADPEGQADFPGGDMAAHHAGEAVQVADP
jgi:hypothetical protein